MNFNDRAEYIIDQLEKNAVVSAAELGQRLDVSAVTVRKDLQRLENQGLLLRTFGGATRRQSKSAGEPAGAQQIAARVAQEIRDGDSLIINAGNTTLLIARQLLGRKNLKLITNSIPISKELSNHGDLQLIFLGGELNPSAVFTHGEDAANQLSQYKADKLVLSVSGISCSRGLTTRHAEATDLFRKMIERSRQVIVAADHTKIGFESFCHICHMQAVDKLITNAGHNEKELEAIEKLGIEVVRC